MAVRPSGPCPIVGITARNPEKLVDFYGGFLGFPLVETRDMPKAGACVWFFAIGDGLIKILRFDETPKAANPPGGNRDATGYRYLAIDVEDVEEILEGLEAAGGRVQRPITEQHGPTKVLFIEDPEGNCIEFVQRLTADR